MIEVVIPGELRGKGRPRFGRARNGAPVAFTPERTRNAEAWVRSCAAQAHTGAPLEGALSIVLHINVAIPASWSKRKREDALAGAIFPTGKPDLDNQLKLVGDACNGILWQDDKQIVRALVTRGYAEAPSATLTVCEV